MFCYFTQGCGVGVGSREPGHILRSRESESGVEKIFLRSRESELGKIFLRSRSRGKKLPTPDSFKVKKTKKLLNCV